MSYSDGEGSGGVGVGLWLPNVRPRAAFLEVPWLLRRLWSMQCSRVFRGEDQREIYEIEAIGPLIVLHQWAEALRDMLWIHCIDNAAAQAAIIKGSSSVQSADTIVGITWEAIAKVNCLPWIDRVASTSNPVDGLSRGKLEGPWCSM